jgi:hypothetical protein
MATKAAPKNYWDPCMASLWVSPGPKIAESVEALFVDAADIFFLKNLPFTPKLELVIIFVIFRPWTSLLYIPSGLLLLVPGPFYFLPPPR